MSADDASMKRDRDTSDGDSEAPVDEKTPPAKQAHLTTEDDESKTADDVDEEPIAVVTNTSKYEKVVRSAAFVDKTRHIRSLFQFKGKAKTLLFAAPFRCGKSTNMDMVKKFLRQEVDESGRPKINVIRKGKKGWEEKVEEEQTASFKLFKNLEIYQCHCHHRKEECASGKCEPTHTEEDCLHGECDHRNFFYNHCGKHIVVFINLASVGYGSVQAVRESLKVCLRKAFLEHRYLENSSHLSLNDQKHISKYIDAILHSTLSSADVSNGLQYLVEYLVKHFHALQKQEDPAASSRSPKRRVFVMVEEYDAHISSLLCTQGHVEEEDIRKVTDVISKAVACVLKHSPDDVFGGLVNACRDVSGTLSQHANNVKPIVFLEDLLFAGYCGFTADEVHKLLQKNAFKNVDKKLMESYYNGYHVLGQQEQKVYNTYSILNHLNEWIELRKGNMMSPEKGAVQPKHYYVERGVVKLEEMFAIDAIRKEILCMLEGKKVSFRDKKEKFTVHELFLLKNLLHTLSSTGPSRNEITLFFHYLKHHGFIFATEKNEQMVTLAVPNKEIALLFYEKLWTSSFYKKKYNVEPRKYLDAVKRLKADDRETFQVLANSIIEMFPKPAKPSRYDELKGILYSSAFESSEFPVVESEPYVMEGRKFRCDVRIWREDEVGIVFEVASSGKNAREALEQIFANRYCKSLDKKGCTGKVYIGLVYDCSQERTQICAYATNGETKTSRCPKMEDCIIVSGEKKRQ